MAGFLLRDRKLHNRVSRGSDSTILLVWSVHQNQSQSPYKPATQSNIVTALRALHCLGHNRNSSKATFLLIHKVAVQLSISVKNFNLSLR